MSLVKRFIRYLQTNRASELQMRDLVGIAGEQYAAKFLDPTAVASYVANPVLPHPNNGQKYLETDLLVYAAGTLFCVEIKNYRGVISHASASDPGQIVQQKIGRYGEAISRKAPSESHPPGEGFCFSAQNLSRHTGRSSFQEPIYRRRGRIRSQRRHGHQTHLELEFYGGHHLCR
jgi:hypothetical protein